MAEKKVSVIVPVYNEERYLKETNKYIKEQTLKDIEIIYIDDGSTDDTINILEEIKSEDDRVIVLHQQNCYAGVARNKGIDIAKGKYMVFWDSDDMFHSDALEKMYNKMEADNADICVCGANHYDEVADKLLSIKTYLKEDMIPDYEPFERRDVEKYLFNFANNVPWNKMYRSAFIKENNLRYQDIRQANDNYFTMMAFYNAKIFTVVREPLLDYRINYGTSLTGKASNTPLCVYEAYSKTYEELKDKDDFENIKQSFLNKTLRGFCYFLTKQTSFEAYKEIFNKFKEDVFLKWGFPEDKDFYYVEKDYERLCQIREIEVNQFLLEEYKGVFDTIRLHRDAKNKAKENVKKQKEKFATQKEKLEKKIENQKEKIENLKSSKEVLKYKNSKLKDKIMEIESSTSYKIGRLITFIPRKIKDMIKGRK